MATQIWLNIGHSDGLLPDRTFYCTWTEQCWLIIKCLLWHSPESDFTRRALEINREHVIGNICNPDHGPLICAWHLTVVMLHESAYIRATSTMSATASVVAPSKLIVNNIHIKPFMNTQVLLHIYVTMYVTLSCFVQFAGNNVTTTTIIITTTTTSPSTSSSYRLTASI